MTRLCVLQHGGRNLHVMLIDWAVQLLHCSAMFEWSLRLEMYCFNYK